MAENVPLCYCNVPARSGIVVQPDPMTIPNPHVDREFWCCGIYYPNHQGSKCIFHKWKIPQLAEELEQPQCSCGRPASLRTVKYKTWNEGRQYWVCKNFPEANSNEYVYPNRYCDFHLWIHLIPRQNFVPYCPCGLPAELRIVSNEASPNKGRRFWGCMSYDREEESSPCDYFMWE